MQKMGRCSKRRGSREKEEGQRSRKCNGLIITDLVARQLNRRIAQTNARLVHPHAVFCSCKALCATSCNYSAVCSQLIIRFYTHQLPTTSAICASLFLGPCYFFSSWGLLCIPEC